LLYAIGRLWGPVLLRYNWVRKHLLPPARLERIERNFQRHGIKILLFARLTPGIRGPIFFTAGLTRLSLVRFLVADALYAVPGVTLLFFLGYWFTGSMVNLIENEVETVKHVIIIVIILGVICYLVYRFLRVPQVTGDPKEVPPLAEQLTQTIGQVTQKLGEVTTKVAKSKAHRIPGADPASAGNEDGEPRYSPRQECNHPTNTRSGSDALQERQ
jgi:hypothetical protein